MAVAIPFVMLGLTALSAASSAKAGADSAKAQKADAKFQEQQLQVAGNNAMATGERAATEERKQAGLAQSRAVALAAAGGGGASDPTVMNILGNLAGAGEYNALSQLYNAQSEATGDQNQSNALKAGVSATASATQTAGMLQGIGTAFNGGSSFLSKYGGGDTGTLTSADVGTLGTDASTGLSGGGFMGVAG